MSKEHGDRVAFDNVDHQVAFVFAPNQATEEKAIRPTKKRKIVKPKVAVPLQRNTATAPGFGFEKLLNGAESLESVNLRQQLYEQSWSEMETRIQSTLNDANEGTLAEVVSFLESSSIARERETLIPTGFIVTGPNIASQGLLFNQLSPRLKRDINGPTVLLRSGESSNLKAALKQIIRDATNQNDRLDDDTEEADHLERYGRKYLNYDLEILHQYVKTHGFQKVVVVFQDSEAFDNDLLADLIKLFSSWSDRIPFAILFGVATTVELFHERLSRSASRCLSGAQFDVENTAVVLERIFIKTIACASAPLILGANLISSLIERQKNHLQSVQSFTTALKYAYMCHFYGNPLSILNDLSRGMQIMSAAHLEAVRTLPSFRNLFESQLQAQRPAFARSLLDDDKTMTETVETHLGIARHEFVNILRVVRLVRVLSTEPLQAIELYLAAFDGTLSRANHVQQIIESIKRMTPDEVLQFLKRVKDTISTGCSEMDLAGWEKDASESLQDLDAIVKEVSLLIKESSKTGDPLRSSYAIHSKGLRTTVIAQRVQLSFEQSKLSKQDQSFTALIDDLSKILEKLFTCPNPQELFLHEVWHYDSTSPYEDVFTPRPRHAIEHALLSPHDYLNCSCCKAEEGILATQPATATLYQMYLQAGSLINTADLWSAFLDNQNQDDDEDFDERKAIVQFYQGLVDLKLLGMVKQSKKKVDHLAKVSWQGL